MNNINRNSKSRDQILDALSNPSGMTAQELSFLCGIGEAAVRFHLRNLILTDEICEIQQPTTENHTGRKYHKYRRNNINPFSNINHLCGSLIEKVLEVSEFSNQDLITNLAKSLVDKDLDSTITGSKKMNEILAWLNIHRYNAVWEASSVGPRVLFRNCPYRDLGIHKEFLCSLDEKILEVQTGNVWKTIKNTCWERMDGECEFVGKLPSVK